MTAVGQKHAFSVPLNYVWNVAVIVMQRLHEDDLVGHLLEIGKWEHLCLPAIAEVAEEIPIGASKIKRRAIGEALHPGREPLTLLEETRRTVGSMVFSAQYQQAPVPAGGNLVERRWLRHYATPPEWRPGDRIVQSWDTASKDGVMNDFSVCITALVRKREVYILHVFRDRLTFPALRTKVVSLARQRNARVLLIEDAASGAQLIQQLRVDQPAGVPRPIARKPAGDKLTRMAAQTSRIEAGELILPNEAPWLAVFEREILGFPGGRHDDQVDALSQLLAWTWKRRPLVAAGPSVG
jgi:predicted phage terminase large subunit-like protein